MAKPKVPNAHTTHGRPAGGRRPFYLLLAVVALVAVAAMVWASRRAGPSTVATVDPTLPPPQVEGYLLGNPDAPIEVQEWADFECPGCMQFATVTEPDVRTRLVETGQVKFRYFFYPLTEIHPAAAEAAHAAACAADQQKFWEMHDALFQGFNDWAAGRARNPRNVFRGYAERAGLDEDAWDACMESGRHRALVAAHRAEGDRRGVGSTPTFFIGGRRIEEVLSYDRLKLFVDSAAAAGAAGAQP